MRAYGRRTGSAEQKAFEHSILAMSAAEIARHWLRQKNQRGLTPPKGVSSDRMAVKYVKKHKEAFAIMRREVAQRGGLRILMKI